MNLSTPEFRAADSNTRVPSAFTAMNLDGNRKESSEGEEEGFTLQQGSSGNDITLKST